MNDELIEALEGARNFLAGMRFDLRIPEDTREAMLAKSDEIDEVLSQIEII